MVAEETRLWRYTATKDADDWTRGKSYVMAAESELPELERQRGIVIDPKPVADDELLTVDAWLYRGPGLFHMKRRATIGKTDATYLQLISEAEAAPDKATALAKLDEAAARADALLAVADAEVKAGG